MPPVTKTPQRSITAEQLRSRIIGIGLLFVVCFVIAFPSPINRAIRALNNKTNLGIPQIPDKEYNLGLDLRGGAHLVYEADTHQIPTADQSAAVEGLRDVIERRARGNSGVTEALVQTTKVGSTYRIIVELPGVANVNEAIKQIGETPILEFKEINTAPPRDLTAEEQKQLADFNKKAADKAKQVLKDLSQKKDFATLAKQYSEDDQTKDKGGDLGIVTAAQYPEIYTWAKTHKVGEVSKEAITSATGLNILKKLADKPGETEVNASHLLVCYKGATGCDNPQYSKEEAKAKAEEIKKQITVQNFGEMVKKYSTEPGAVEREGSLGLVKKGDMVPEFEKALFALANNSISGVIETQFGYHIIYRKGEQASVNYQMARIFVKTKQKTDIVPPSEEWKFTGLSGNQLKKAEVVQDPRTGQVQVSLQFNDEGSKLFEAITTRNVNKPLAIFLDNQLIGNPPNVSEPIPNGQAVISGGFSFEQARLMAQRLNAGSLPVPVELISQEKVDATLGAASLEQSFKAGILGLIAVIIFMIVYYRFPGLLSVFSLLLYTALSLAAFKLMGVTLTLSGIAGFILSIGMAVDANVLVFERLKEELQAGKDLQPALEESFVRSWPSIRDSHITALISCIFLVWFGSGFIKGFAVILALGTLINLFTAYIITRTIMRLIVRLLKNRKSKFLFLGGSSQQ